MPHLSILFIHSNLFYLSKSCFYSININPINSKEVSKNNFNIFLFHVILISRFCISCVIGNMMHLFLLSSVLGHHAMALKYYLEAAIVVTDFFSQPVPRAVIDDHVYRRMIKCCIHLQCHTQV